MTTPDPDKTARIDTDVRFRMRTPGNDAQYAPGTMIAGRYRIAGLLGSGGMGEVYRADDVKLGQAVALKFLPARLARDPHLLDRLHDEVRLGRQVAHPNVCRIYDIGEFEDAHFVAMEYVDGEDLARLLHRIGRLAHDKAVDIARGIASGLAAAHAKGILHRDLKPANIMLDSHGEARITDFGLALAPGESDSDAGIAGTPAYMAPELLTGGRPTVQSDLYALGLVMYELFTGKRVYSSRSIAETRREHSSEITTPSSVVRDIDPAVERIILRCLDREPTRRPRSGREIIDALPGGDPLAAALAAGETPSPRIVAAAGTEGTLKPWQAWTLLGLVAALMTALFAFKQYQGPFAFLPPPKSTDTLLDRAVEIRHDLGIASHPFRSVTILPDDTYHAWLREHDPSLHRWQRLAHGPAVFGFVVRETPEPELELPEALQATNPLPVTARGASRVQLDLQGRLTALQVLAPAQTAAHPPDWNALLRAAGLDATRLRSVPPSFVPTVFADTRAAWRGTYPDDAAPIEVEAATLRGTPVWFRVTGPWEAEANALKEKAPFAGRRLTIFVTILIISVVGLALLLAIRNLRARRSDRSGALRIAAIMFAAVAFAQLATIDLQPSVVHVLDVLILGIAAALYSALLVYIYYTALEPTIRRHWPQMLISWSRVTTGAWRDPMVGRDVLIGISVGMLHAACAAFSAALPRLIGRDAGAYYTLSPAILLGTRHAFGWLGEAAAFGIKDGLNGLVVIVLATIVLRRRWLGVAAGAALILTFFFLATPDALLMPVWIVVVAAIVFVTTHYGLIAFATVQAVFSALFFPAWSFDSAHIAGPLIVAGAVAALAVWAFRTALGSQSAFGEILAD